MLPDENGILSSTRMVPPGEVKFYYSHGEKVLIAEDQPLANAEPLGVYSPPPPMNMNASTA
jgi:hypothetical protein